MSLSEEYLCARDVSKRYSRSGRAALSPLSFDLLTGTVMGLVGPNGAGKTTLLRILAGLTHPSTGVVEICGRDLKRQKAAASLHVGFVPELPAYNPSERLASILRFHAGYYGLGGEAARSRSASLLDFVGLGPQGRLRYKALSQGMQKRFALAAALLGNPKVILLDEILNGLDPGGVALIRRLIRERAKAGCAVLLSSHLLPEVQNLCDVIWMLDQGQVLRIIRKEEWEGSKTQFIRISLAGDLSGAVELLGQFGRVEQTPRELVILEPKAGSAEVNEALVKSGFRVQRIGEESRSLEDIYLEALEREN